MEWHNVVSGLSRTLRLRQPKIEQFRARFGQHDVRGLEIAMDDARAVRLVERVADVDGDLQGVVRTEAAATGKAFANCLPFEILSTRKSTPS